MKQAEYIENEPKQAVPEEPGPKAVQPATWALPAGTYPSTLPAEPAPGAWVPLDVRVKQVYPALRDRV